MPGLKTVEALQFLHTELSKVVDEHTRTQTKEKWRHFLSAMRGKSTCFSPFSLVCLLVISVSLFIAAFVDSDGAASDNKWVQRSYPMLHLPISPCISLQWIMRDGYLVNLPHPLLVEGDVIIMRPGLSAPGDCKSVDDDTCLVHGEVFSGSSPQAKGDGPQPRVPMSSKKFILQETPILKNFRYSPFKVYFLNAD
ncbi:hypothetical protein ElyMa_006339400 [Elysia marginata]|uniref:Cation-transporting P-type ATPase N-terminal domain-containing protein n=1 Tax=Elysia marginata TaxID=1093978 RepID=A0AAV4HKU9_9GAST|nr:hypothetical protein ElyMa_006339400 [Elysia marginata]